MDILAVPMSVVIGLVDALDAKYESGDSPSFTNGTYTGSVSANLLTAPQIHASATGYLFWAGRTQMSAPSNGTLVIENNVGTAGCRWDYATDATAKLFNRAGTGAGNLDVSGFGTVRNGLNVFGSSYPASYVKVLPNEYAFHTASAGPCLVVSDYSAATAYGISVENSGSLRIGNAGDSSTIRMSTGSVSVTATGSSFSGTVVAAGGIAAGGTTPSAGNINTSSSYLFNGIRSMTNAFPDLTINIDGGFTTVTNVVASGSAFNIVPSTQPTRGLAIVPAAGGTVEVYPRAWGAFTDAGGIQFANGLMMRRGDYCGVQVSQTDAACYMTNRFGTPDIRFFADSPLVALSTHYGRLAVRSGEFGFFAADNVTQLLNVSSANGIQCYKNIVPNGSRDNGLAAARWANVFGTNGDFSNTLTAGNTAQTNLTPAIIAYRGAGYQTPILSARANSSSTQNWGLFVDGAANFCVAPSTPDAPWIVANGTSFSAIGNIICGAASKLSFSGRSIIKSPLDANLDFRNAADSGWSNISAGNGGFFGDLTTTGSFELGAAGSITWTGRSRLTSPANNQFALKNNAGSNLLTFDATSTTASLGTSNYLHAPHIQADGGIVATTDIESTTVGSGFILKSPDGTRWRIEVSNAGALSALAA